MKTHIDKQVLYNGRWVDREHFAVFVYNSTGQKLVKNYTEYQDLITSGIWFSSKKDLENHLKDTHKVAEKPEPEAVATESTVVQISATKRGKNGRTTNIG